MPAGRCRSIASLGCGENPAAPAFIAFEGLEFPVLMLESVCDAAANFSSKVG